MDRILQTQNENYIIIEELKKELQTWQIGIENIDRSLDESRMIALDLQSTANTKAVKILAEAEAIIASNNDKINHIEHDIAALHKELDTYLQINQEKNNTAPISADCISTTFSSELLPIHNKPAPSDEPTSSPALITMKLVAFLNAKHYMVFGNKKGITHGHSWQFQVEAAVSVQDSSFVKFEDLDRYINKLIAPYQRSVLNEVAPFDTIEPLTENIAALFFNQLEDDFQKFNVKLIRVTVWENPTKGIEITQRLPKYFSTGSSIKTASPSQTAMKAANEVAASQDANDEDTNEEINNNQVDSETTNDDEIRLTSESSIEADQIMKEATRAYPESIKEDLHRDNKTQDPNGQKMTLDPLSPAESLNDDEADDIYSKNTSLEGQTYRHYPVWQYFLALLIITGVAVWAYWPILNAQAGQIYPWGSDSWGHLYKASFLYEEIMHGNYFPQFTSEWYNGCQPFRYWAPLPYYFIALINHFNSNIFVAGNYYIFICALIGAIAWLVWSRRIGVIPVIMIAIVWLIWPNNLKIAFSEGNYPRILTTAILPLLVYCFLITIEKGKIYSLVLTVMFIHLIILCHAMMGAIYCICLMMFAFFLWIFNGCTLKGVLVGFIALMTGILSSSWWLIPSLKGGLAGMGKAAAGGAVEYVSALISFNPLVRFDNPLLLYWGISILILILFSCVLWRAKPAWSKALFICGMITILITLPSFSWLHKLLPLNHILWPLRFTTFGTLSLLAFGFAFSHKENQIINKKGSSIYIVMVLVFIVLFIDSYYSANILINCRPAPSNIEKCASAIKDLPGWRVGTLDLSGLDSSPSFFFSKRSKREQVFGWAWQGATTAQNIMLLNTALEFKCYPFLFKELTQFGTTDLVVRNDLLKVPERFAKEANSANYYWQNDFNGISLWHSNQIPYMLVRKNEGLAIGKHASIYALQFPWVEIGSSIIIDDYSITQLKQYPLIILTGADWHSQKKAEQLIMEYANFGGKVVIDFTGFPVDVLSRQPKFLGVYAEPVELRGNLKVYSSLNYTELKSFDEESPQWRSLTPQGLDVNELWINYMGNSATIFGYKLIDGTKIWFIGGNLAYHAYLTEDITAKNILQDLLNVSTEYTPPTKYNFLTYEIKSDGYQMTYNLKKAEQVIIPIAALEGIQAQLDKKPIKTSKCENLISINLPAGYHTINFTLTQPPVFTWGRYISIFSIFLIFGILLFYRNKMFL